MTASSWVGIEQICHNDVLWIFARRQTNYCLFSFPDLAETIVSERLGLQAGLEGHRGREGGKERERE